MRQRKAAGILDGEPGDFRMLPDRAVARHAGPRGHGVELQDDRSVPTGKGLAELAERAPLRWDHARLLAQLPDQRLLRGLARLQMPPEHVPHAGVERAFRLPLAEQYERRPVGAAVRDTARSSGRLLPSRTSGAPPAPPTPPLVLAGARAPRAAGRVTVVGASWTPVSRCAPPADGGTGQTWPARPDRRRPGRRGVRS